MQTLGPKFFNRSAVRVAKDLLGKLMCRRRGGKTVCLRIIETEAYGGEEDLASHARFGWTKRNAPMYASGGRWYVYFTYGMHWMLNVITGKKGHPSGVLIRGVEGVNGPARVTKFFKIGKSASRRINNRPISRKAGLWISDAPLPRGVVVRASPRIGVNYSGPVWSKKKWRFFLKTL